MKLGSLFSGIGGLDLGLERAGMHVAWQCENDPRCRKILARYWPGLPIYDDIRRIAGGEIEPAPVDLLAGGDPCPVRSRARGTKPSRSPDLSGFFLAVAGRLRPWWVVRENVPAPDVVYFVAGLELLGYGTVIAEYDSADFTGQRRQRQFCVGCLGPNATERLRHLLAQHCFRGVCTQKAGPEKAVFTCLVAHPKRFHSNDTFIYESAAGRMRVLTNTERERLQGFPAGWTAGASFYGGAKMLGNAVTVPVAENLGRFIMEASQ